MSRGHTSGALFVNDANRARFLAAASGLPERFALELQVFALMRTQPNLRHAIGWLNVAYVVNSIGRTGGAAAFQRRFKAILIHPASTPKADKPSRLKR